MDADIKILAIASTTPQRMFLNAILQLSSQKNDGH